MWFSKRHKPEVTDFVWFSKSDKSKAIVAAAQKAVSSGHNLIILAHFRTTLSELTGILDSAGIPHRTISHPMGSETLQEEQAEAGSGEVALGLSERIGRYAESPGSQRCCDRIEIIVAEHYPTEDRDDTIVSFAGALGTTREVRFHSSLEDPLFREFGSDRYAEALMALSRGSQGPMTGKPISRAIRAAQRKVRQASRGDQHVSSPEEWFTYNTHRGRAGKTTV